MSRGKMTWDGDADQHLLLSILATHTIKLDHAAIAQHLGPNCTPRAVEERLKKLKKMAKERGFDEQTGNSGQKKADDPGADAKSAPSTPSKKRKTADGGSARKAAAKGKATAVKGANKKSKATSSPTTPKSKRSRDEFEDDANEAERKVSVKEEQEDGGEDGLEEEDEGELGAEGGEEGDTMEESTEGESS